jgi:hypothetical protein
MALPAGCASAEQKRRRRAHQIRTDPVSVTPGETAPRHVDDHKVRPGRAFAVHSDTHRRRSTVAITPPPLNGPAHRPIEPVQR